MTLRVEGSARTLPADAGLALYRGAQEALTNVARYAPGAHHRRPELRARSHHAERRGPRLQPRPRRPQPGWPTWGADGDSRAARAAGTGRRQHARRPDRRRLARRAAGARVTGAPIRVLVADDQRTVRDGLTMLVGLIDGRRGRWAACDGVEAVELAPPERPDVVLMDLRMPRMEGAEATRQYPCRAPRHAGAGAHDLRRRRIAVPRATGRRARLSDQGRERRGDRAGHQSARRR